MKLTHVFITGIAGLLFSGSALAQRPVPVTYTGPVNYVKSWDATAPIINAADVLTKPIEDVKLSTQYIDGLGRPKQTVVRKGSLTTGSTPKDMVAPLEYDELGREAFKYLPYAEASTNDGSFKSGAFASQASFMSATYGSGIQEEDWYYGQTDFEASPLNRPAKQMAAGDNWVGAVRGMVTKYWNNTSIDAVKKWNPGTTANELPFVSTAGTTTGDYAAGELVKMITIDEHGKQVIEFKDKDGKVILKKVQLTAAADDGSGKNHADWLCTYYIYDIYNNLRCVIQPRGVELLAANSWNLDALSDKIQAEQCFLYAYDQQNRMTIKKVPGAAAVYMVYDKKDRLVMTQDGNMGTGTAKWLVTKYDALNRPIETGLWENASSASAHWTAAASAVTDYPTTSGTYTILSNTWYDNYSFPWGPFANANYFTTWDTYLQPSSGSWPYPQPNIKSNATKGLVTGTRTLILGTSVYIYTATIYDAKGRPIQVQSTNLTSNGSAMDVSTTQYSWAGQPLINIHRNVVTVGGIVPDQHLTVVTQNTYDELGRVIKIEKRQAHTNVNSGAMSNYKTIAEMEYDALGQLKKKKLAPAYNGTGLEHLAYDYNIRGWMLGMNRWYARDASLPANTPSGSGYFGFDLGYDKTANGLINSQTYAVAQYNGNISGTVWKSKGDGEKRQYNYTYDNANRLLQADFKQYSAGSFINDPVVNYDVKMGDGSSPTSAYDANGNIQQMQHWGLLLNNSAQIDDLSYKYEEPNGVQSNRLKTVVDVLNDPATKLGDFRTATTHPQYGTKNITNIATITDYTYDANGNMVRDYNKAIGNSSNDGIVYNHLNLPSVVTIRNAAGGVKGTITYTYTAAGEKIQKITEEKNVEVNPGVFSDVTTNTLYMPAGIVYESKLYSNGALSAQQKWAVLQFIGHEEGRIRYKPAEGAVAASLQYDYMIKDHLGNVRMLLTDEDKQIFYPAATLEGTLGSGANSMVNFEKGYYRIDDTKIVSESAIPSWGTETTGNTKLYYNNNGNPPANLNYPSGASPTQTDGSSKLYKLNATTNRTGLDFVIKVMAGDKIDILGNSYHNNTSTINNSNSTALNLSALMSSMLLSPSSALSGKGLTEPILSGINTGLIPASFFRGANGETTTTPKAFINYIFLDEQFKYARGGASRVGTNGVVKRHWYDDAVLQNITVPKNGYIFVYVSNESNVDVFFDNLQVIHKPGPILEETHYYPFGLTMTGISSKAAGSLINKEKTFQDQRFDDDLGLNWVQFKWRNHDPQIGRFIEIDPLANDYVYNSTYAFSENQVTGHVELEGLEKMSVNKLLTINPTPMHHKKDMSTINLSLSAVLQSSNKTEISVRDNSTPAKDFIGTFNSTINEGNRIHSVSEINTRVSSTIIENEAGKFLAITTTTTSTTVLLEQTKITGINTTTSSSTSYTPIVNIDKAANSITLSATEGSVGKPISTINQFKLSDTPSENLKLLSPELQKATQQAIFSNVASAATQEKTLGESLDKLQKL